MAIIEIDHAAAHAQAMTERRTSNLAACYIDHAATVVMLKAVIAQTLHAQAVVVVGVKPDDYKRWREGEYIQNVMPYLTADEREELMSGTSKEGWDILFKEEDV